MIEQTVAELLKDHVTLDLEGIDRLYLNLYQPRLHTGGGVATFFKAHRGAKVASTVLMAPISRIPQGRTTFLPLVIKRAYRLMENVVWTDLVCPRFFHGWGLHFRSALA
jgi:hypothetical protein